MARDLDTPGGNSPEYDRFVSLGFDPRTAEFHASRNQRIRERGLDPNLMFWANSLGDYSPEWVPPDVDDTIAGIVPKDVAQFGLAALGAYGGASGLGNMLSAAETAGASTGGTAAGSSATAAARAAGAAGLSGAESALPALSAMDAARGAGASGVEGAMTALNAAPSALQTARSAGGAGAEGVSSALPALQAIQAAGTPTGATPAPAGAQAPSAQVPGSPSSAASMAASSGAAGAAGAALPTGAGAAAGAAGGTSFVDSLIKQMKDNALGLGLIGAGALASSGQKTQLPNEQQIQALGADAQGVARQLIQQYQSNTLSPGQQASLDQLAQNTRNQLKQYFANIGQSDSTAAVQALAQVDQSVLSMKQQMLDSALQQGLSAIGVAQGPFNTIAQYQLGQDQQLRQAFGNFATGVGTLFGRGAGTPTPTGTAVSPPQQTQTSTTATPMISSVQ